MTSTRERILIESSRLFAQKGYLDTSTRDIAQAVGVRQPSLFYHFSTKAEIFAELLSRDLNLALEQLRLVSSDTAEDSIAAKLFAYLMWNATAISQLHTSILGLYDRDALGEEEFAAQWALRSELHQLTEHLVQAGVDSGDFTSSPEPAFVRQAISALTLNAARNKALDAASASGDDEQLALFIVRSIITDAARIDDVRARGIGMWERLSAAHPFPGDGDSDADADAGS